MKTSNPLDLARIKLNELRRQRDRLTAHYSALESPAEPLSEMDRLRGLTEGLRSARFAQTALHPEVEHMPVHLAVLETESEFGTPSSPMIRRWIERLEAELRQGRTRVEFAYLFGQLLEEDLAAEEPAPPPEPDEAAWAGLWTAGEEVDHTILDEAIASRPEPFEKLCDELCKFNEIALKPATEDEVKTLLQLIARTPTRSPEIRQQAQAVAASRNYVNEYADVLTILLDRFEEWGWPAEGVPLRGGWSHGRCRPFLERSLLDLLFIELLALRWGMCIKNAAMPLVSDGGFFPNPRPGAPPKVEPFSQWLPYALKQREHELRRQLISGAAESWLLRIPRKLEDAPRAAYPGKATGGQKGPAPSGLEGALMLLQGLIEAHQALKPDEGMFVMSLDFKNFFPSLSHELLVGMLARLGLSEKWQRFFETMLATSVQWRGQQRVVRRGLLQEGLFNWILSGLLLTLLDVLIFARSGLRTIRVGDDLYLFSSSAEAISTAWQTARDFAARAGLTFNADKCGTVSLSDSPVPSGCPDGLPRWCGLRLHPDGQWRVDDAPLAAQTAWLREHLAAAPSILSMVSRYNAEMQYILYRMGLRGHLGAGHLKAVGERLTALHQNLFSEGVGIEEAILQRAEARLGGRLFGGEQIPSPLLYWPITAGGLGLRHPLIQVVALRQDLRRRTVPEVPRLPEGLISPKIVSLHSSFLNQVGRYTGSCIRYLTALRAPLTARPPAQTPHLKALMADFIQRGSELGGREQVSLGVYWQWVVYTYGLPLLDAVGSFRFLLTELVPLPLILEGQNVVDIEAPRRTDQPPPRTDDDIPF